jgi:hypothetical protein
MRLDPPFGDGVTVHQAFLASGEFFIHRQTENQATMTIDTEIEDLTLTGPSPVGPIQVRIGINNSIDPVPLPTLGVISQVISTGGPNREDFIFGNSFFDVFFEVDIPTLGMTLYNRQTGLLGDDPHHLTAPGITELPPNGSEHFPFGAPPFVNLYWQQNPLMRQPSDPRVGIAFGTHKVFIPEPSSVALFGLGCLGLIGCCRRGSEMRAPTC